MLQCYLLNTWSVVSTSCVQQSFPKLQLEVNVMVLENGGSGMSLLSFIVTELTC